jgi:hypothetical protein
VKRKDELEKRRSSDKGEEKVRDLGSLAWPARRARLEAVAGADVEGRLRLGHQLPAPELRIFESAGYLPAWLVMPRSTESGSKKGRR